MPNSLNLRSSFRLVLTLLILYFAGCTTPIPDRPAVLPLGDYSYMKRYASWLIETEMKKYHVTGLSVAVVDGQEVVWTQGFGYADQAQQIAAGPETIYRIGSITKLFTATAIMQLVEQNRLDLNQPLQAVLSEFAIKTRFDKTYPITVRNVLTHHAGLPRDFLAGQTLPPSEPFHQVASLLKDEYVAYPPNEMFYYSNLGFDLLGQVVERISGLPYTTYIDRNLLQPLDMKGARFSTTSPAATKGYRDGTEASEMTIRDMPAGGLNASVLDLSWFIQMVFAGGKSSRGKQIIQPDTLMEMLRPQHTKSPLDGTLKMGLGWFLSPLNDRDIHHGGVVAGHGGTTRLHHAELRALLDHKLGVVILSNSSSSGAMLYDAAAKILSVALESKIGIRKPDSPGIGPLDTPLPAAQRRAIAGAYTTMRGLLKLVDDGTTLVATISGKELRLVPFHDGTMGLQYRWLGLIPIMTDELRGIRFRRLETNGRELLAQGAVVQLVVGEKLQPKRIPQAWKQRIGEYEVVNFGLDEPLFQTIVIKVEDEHLLAEFHGPDIPDQPTQLVLNPLDDQHALAQSVLVDRGEMVRIEEDGKEEIAVFSGYRARRKKP